MVIYRIHSFVIMITVWRSRVLKLSNTYIINVLFLTSWTPVVMTLTTYGTLSPACLHLYTCVHPSGMIHRETCVFYESWYSMMDDKNREVQNTLHGTNLIIMIHENRYYFFFYVPHVCFMMGSKTGVCGWFMRSRTQLSECSQKVK